MNHATRQQAAERVMARADALAAISETQDSLTACTSLPASAG